MKELQGISFKAESKRQFFPCGTDCLYMFCGIRGIFLVPLEIFCQNTDELFHVAIHWNLRVEIFCIT